MERILDLIYDDALVGEVFIENFIVKLSRVVLLPVSVLGNILWVIRRYWNSGFKFNLFLPPHPLPLVNNQFQLSLNGWSEWKIL